MAQRADGESLSKFLRDRELLPYNDAEIARRMGMDRSNFSSYVNGHLPITRSFLRRFYSVLGQEVEVMQARRRGVLEGNGVKERLEVVEEKLNWLMEEFRKMRGADF
jgi:transcriptional regulator with XRE-family HTH domain